MKTFIQRFVRDESGAALAEYAAIFLVLAVAGSTILILVGGTLQETGTAIEAWLRTNVLAPFQAANG